MSKAFITQSPEDVINQLRPDHQTIKRHDGGDNRDVVVVDEEEAFRFAKDVGGMVSNSYEFEALRLIEGKLTVAVPRPIDLAPDGSYNILSFLQGNVMSKHEVAALSFDDRRNLGLSISNVINELNTTISKEELKALQLATSPERSLVRSKDGYYAGVYEIAGQQNSTYARVYRENYERLQSLRPEGSASNIIVFGDFGSPNLVLSDDNKLSGLIDWTELGLGDIHDELRPVFSVIGQEAFDEMVTALDLRLGPIKQDVVRTLAVIHELSVLVNGKQKGTLKPERLQLAMDSLDQWLADGWAA